MRASLKILNIIECCDGPRGFSWFPRDAGPSESYTPVMVLSRCRSVSNEVYSSVIIIPGGSISRLGDRVSSFRPEPLAYRNWGLSEHCGGQTNPLKPTKHQYYYGIERFKGCLIWNPMTPRGLGISMSPFGVWRAEWLAINRPCQICRRKRDLLMMMMMMMIMMIKLG